MRYNECNGLMISTGVIFTDLIEDGAIFEVSSYVLQDVDSNEIQANFDLTITGNIEAITIRVQGNFICLGECKCNDLFVQGNCTILNQLTADSIFVGENLQVGEMSIIKAEVKGNVLCASIECESAITVDGNIVATEGILGSGYIQAKLCICGEYNTIDTENGGDNIFIVDEIKDRTVLDKVNLQSQITEMQEFGRTAEWVVLSETLEKFVDEYPKYIDEFNDYTKMLELVDLNSVNDLKIYMDVVEVLFKPHEIIGYSDLAEVIYNDLYMKSKNKVFSLDYDKMDESEFVKYLKIIHDNRIQFKEKEYKYLLEKLYNKIGLKYSSVSMILNI